jgi:hypothetical protein
MVFLIIRSTLLCDSCTRRSWWDSIGSRSFSCCFLASPGFYPKLYEAKEDDAVDFRALGSRSHSRDSALYASVHTCLGLTSLDQKIYKSTLINKKSVKMIEQSKSFADFGVPCCNLGEHSILFPRSCCST